MIASDGDGLLDVSHVMEIPEVNLVGPRSEQRFPSVHVLFDFFLIAFRVLHGW